MNYIVFDLEFNQAYKDKSSSNPKCPFEIIQIGAIKLNDNFEIIGRFDRLIKPEIYTDLNPFVKDITHISEEDLKLSKCFKDVYFEFMDFLKSDNIILCVWGMADIKEFFRNVDYYKLGTKSIPRRYINLQAYASKLFNCPTGTNISLSTTVELLNITMDNQFHNAYNDALYTAEILKKLYDKTIKIKLYEPEKKALLNKPKKNKIDFPNLLYQFEKMFNRPMTDEEKKIIKLAYMMGKTNQFGLKQLDINKKKR
jgi:inhibitor of KinA sporulation pathway (predicted exonuclease)